MAVAEMLNCMNVTVMRRAMPPRETSRLIDEARIMYVESLEFLIS